MDNPADTLDQADEDILTYTASDEALEAAAGTERGPVTVDTFVLALTYCCCSVALTL
jgi:hypothetical protein